MIIAFVWEGRLYTTTRRRMDSEQVTGGGVGAGTEQAKPGVMLVAGQGLASSLHEKPGLHCSACVLAGTSGSLQPHS